MIAAVVTAVFIFGSMHVTRGEASDDPADLPPAPKLIPDGPATSEVKRAPWTMQQAREAVSKPNATVLIIGDSTGNDDNEWAKLWSQDLAQSRRVTYAAWGEDSYRPQEVYGRGEPIRIWNGSKPGATPRYPVNHWEDLGKKADLIVFNFGHNGSPYSEKSQHYDLLDVVLHLNPDAVVVGTSQNPEKGDAGRENREAVDEWNKAMGIPSIDAFRAFREDGRGEKLLIDDKHPNPDGSRVWADAVGRQLGR